MIWPEVVIEDSMGEGGYVEAETWQGEGEWSEHGGHTVAEGGHDGRWEDSVGQPSAASEPHSASWADHADSWDYEACQEERDLYREQRW